MKSKKNQLITIFFVTLILLSALTGASIGAFLYEYDLFAKGILGVAVFYLLYVTYINRDIKVKNINGLNIQLSLVQRIRYLLLSFCVALVGCLSFLYVYDALMYIIKLSN